MKRNETPRNIDSTALNYALADRRTTHHEREKTKSELVCRYAGRALCWLFAVGSVAILIAMIFEEVAR